MKALFKTIIFVHDLMKAVYPDLQKYQLDKKYISSRAILTPKNDSVDQLFFDWQVQFRFEPQIS